MKILRMPEVIEKTGCARSSIYRKISLGEFPEQIRLGVRTIGWIEDEIDDWIKTQVEMSRL